MKKLFYFSLVLIIVFNINSTTAQDAVINLIHINDSHSNLLPNGGRDANLKSKNGGIARAASVIGYAKMQDQETLLLHAGDIFTGDLMWYNYFGFPELAVLQQLGLDAITVGNHEFDAMTENFLGFVLEANSKLSEINFLSANLVANEGEYGSMLKSMMKDYIIKEVKGVKVGIFGMTSAIANVTSLPNPDIIVSDEYVEISKSVVGQLEDEGCQVIIFLSHLGKNADQFVATQVSGINVIVGSHDHIVTQTPIEVIAPDNKTTYIVQAGSFYQYIGSMKIFVENGKFEGIESEIIKLDENIPEEPSVIAMLDDLIAQLPAEQQVLFNTQVAYCENFMSENVPEPTVEGKKSTDVGCLISDAFRDWGTTDIGFTSSGLCSQPLYEGPIVANDVYRMLGYGINEYDGVGYNMVKFRIKGSDLMTSIIFSLMTVFNDNDDEFLPQVSGMNIEYYSEDYSVCNVTVAGQPIDYDKTYSISSSIFVYMFIHDMLGIELQDVEIFPEVSDFKVVLEYIMKKQIISTIAESDNRIVCPVEENEIIYDNNNVAIFPNPVTDVFTFNIGEDVFINSYRIYDFMGNEVMRSDYINNQINVTNLPTGNYSIKFFSNNNVFNQNFVICR